MSNKSLFPEVESDADPWEGAFSVPEPASDPWESILAPFARPEPASDPWAGVFAVIDAIPPYPKAGA